MPNDKVTFLAYFTQPNRILFGSKDGCVTFYNVAKRETTSFVLHKETRSGMSRILSVLELPSKVADVRKHIYYILSTGNLYAMSKEDRQIQQQFYKGDYSVRNRPRLLQTQILQMSNQFALALIVEGGTLLILDPMTL